MGVLKVRVDDAWEVVGGDVSEMLVSDVDPYVLSPTATEELWYSPVVRQLFARVNDRWEPAVINEVMVSRNDPAGVNPEVELWYDVDATPSSPSTKPVAIDEVWVGGQEPIKPGVELWYDVAAVAVQSPSLPPGGAGGDPLVKASATDQDARWGGDINTGSIFPASGKVIQFPNVTGPKIQLYSTTFGIGVESGTTSIWASGTISFNQNASNGARWAFIDGTCGNGRVITEVTGDARYMRKDTGWQNATLAAGIAGTAQYKDYGPYVFVKYSVTRSVGGNLSAGTMFSVPDAVGPAYTFITSGSNSAGQPVNWKILDSGACQYQSGEQAPGMHGVFVWPKP